MAAQGFDPARHAWRELRGEPGLPSILRDSHEILDEDRKGVVNVTIESLVADIAARGLPAA